MSWAGELWTAWADLWIEKIRREQSLDGLDPISGIPVTDLIETFSFLPVIDRTQDRQVHLHADALFCTLHHVMLDQEDTTWQLETFSRLYSLRYFYFKIKEASGGCWHAGVRKNHSHTIKINKANIIINTDISSIGSKLTPNSLTGHRQWFGTPLCCHNQWLNKQEWI